MLFALICTDHPTEGLERRKSARPEHLAFLESLGDTLIFAGPLMTDDGATPKGSLVVIEADSIEEAKKLSQNDPYAKAGVFSNVEISAWKWLFGNPANSD